MLRDELSAVKMSLRVIRELSGQLSRVSEKNTTGHQRIKACIVVRTIQRDELSAMRRSLQVIRELKPIRRSTDNTKG